MNKNITFFRKIKLFISYWKTIHMIEDQLESEFNIRIDSIGRLYTVLNIPSENFGEPYNLRTNDIDTLSKKWIKDYSNKLGEYLNKFGLFELYDFYSMKKVSKFSYLIVFGFSLFNTRKIFSRLLFVYLPILLISIFMCIYFIN